MSLEVSHTAEQRSSIEHRVPVFGNLYSAAESTFRDGVVFAIMKAEQDTLRSTAYDNCPDG
jgi:hypothetical protein